MSHPDVTRLGPCVAQARLALARLEEIDRRYGRLLRPLRGDGLDPAAAERRRAELEALRAFEQRPHLAALRKAGRALAGHDPARGGPHRQRISP